MNIYISSEEMERVAEETQSTVEQVEVGVKLKPIYNQIVIIRDKESRENFSKGGIQLSDSEAPRRVTGTVVAVGDGVYNARGYRVPCDLNRFDRVRFREGFGEAMTLFGYEFWIVKDVDIMVKLPQ